MIDLSDFIVDNDIYKMKDKIFELLENKNDLENGLKNTPKQNNKEAIKNNLHQSMKNIMIYIQHFRKTTILLNLNLLFLQN